MRHQSQDTQPSNSRLSITSGLLLVKPMKNTKYKQTEIGEIPEDWDIVLASDYCLKVTDGTHNSPKQANEGKFLVTSRHITGGDIDLSKAYKISEQDFQEINKRSGVHQWDILFSMIGTVGEAVLVKNTPVNFAIKNIGLFKNKGEIEAKWLYYYFKSPLAIEYIKSHSSGSTQQYLTLEALRTFPITTTTKLEAERILGILSSLDDKIELNRRMNKTLEEMGKALFKRWFVDFEFPDENGKPYKSSGGEMVESELGLIPKGWEVQSLDEIAYISIGRTPPRLEKEWFSKNPSDMKWISIKDMADIPIYINKTSEYLTRDAIEKFNIPIIPPNTVIVSFKLTVGRLAITTEEMLSNEAIAHIKTEIPPEFIFFSLKNYDFSSLGTTSSIANAVNSKSIRTIKLVMPTKKILQNYTSVVAALFAKVRANVSEISRLTYIRDSLLPRLMSGKLRVN